jgi:L,D-transpeptidase-like protein
MRQPPLSPRHPRPLLPATILSLALLAGSTPAARASVLERESPARAARAQAPAGRQVPAPRPGAASSKLSNERTLSRWAYVERRVFARRRPSRQSHRLRRLRTTTADGTPELVLVLRWLRKRNGELWVKVRLPMRGDGRIGWVPRRTLSHLRTVRTFLRISLRRETASLYRGGQRIWRARLGIGKPGTPTPKGDFYARERMIPREPNTVYGVFAFGTSAYSPKLTDWPGGGIVGIHGTNHPELIPGRVSHGCVRVRNGPMSRLRRLMPLGTPIRID